MTIEEIERSLQKVAENQAAHTGEIAEIDKMLATLVRSQNRYDNRLGLISDIMHDLADKQVKNEERFAETDKRFAQLLDAQGGYEERQGRLEAMFEMLATFVREARAETNGRFDQMAGRVNGVDSRLDRIGEHLDRLTQRVDTLVTSQAKTDEQLRELIAAQIRTDNEQTP